MRRESLIEKTVNALSKLPPEKAIEVADFIDFIFKKYEEELLQKGIEKIVSDSKSFSYLNEEKDIYTVNDLKERYR